MEPNLPKERPSITPGADSLSTSAPKWKYVPGAISEKNKKLLGDIIDNTKSKYAAH